jgi:hypothetical protein
MPRYRVAKGRELSTASASLPTLVRATTVTRPECFRRATKSSSPKQRAGVWLRQACSKRRIRSPKGVAVDDLVARLVPDAFERVSFGDESASLP